MFAEQADLPAVNWCKTKGQGFKKIMLLLRFLLIKGSRAVDLPRNNASLSRVINLGREHDDKPCSETAVRYP